MIIYLHGFGSNGNAFKARLIRRLYPEISLYSPDLPMEPTRAVSLVRTFIQKLANSEPCLLIGSSLGGFFALHLHIEQNIPAILLNPVVTPEKDLQRYLGSPESSNRKLLPIPKEKYIRQLRKLSHPAKSIRSSGLFVYLNRDDEVLDYRVAQNYFQKSRCNVIINEKGGHVFLNFTDLLPEIISVYRNL